MSKLLLSDLLKSLDLGDYGNELENYSGCNSYICDCISEIADNNTSIYYSDIANYMCENPDKVNDYVAEFGIDSKNFDFYKLGQGAEYLDIHNQLYNCLDDSIKNLAIKYYSSEYDTNYIESDLWDLLESELSSIDNSSRFSEISELVNTVVNDYKGV